MAFGFIPEHGTSREMPHLSLSRDTDMVIA